MKAVGEAGRDLAELKLLFVAPSKGSADDAGVSAAGVGIVNPGGEELIGGKQGIGLGALSDGKLWDPNGVGLDCGSVPHRTE